MRFLLIKFFLLLCISFYSYAHADDRKINEILEKIQRDIQTLEKAVYSGSSELDINTSNVSTIENEEIM